MVEAVVAKVPTIGVIALHFDVPGHYLPLETFVETAIHTKSVIDGLNVRLFEGHLKIDLFILPPDVGSFKTKLGVAIVAGFGAVNYFCESYIGKPLIEGLTNHEPAYWAKEAGKYLRTKLLEFDNSGRATPTEEDTRTQFETTIVTEATKSFLQADEMDLRAIDMSPRHLREAYEARNKFYQACAADQQIRALGFEESPNFPIRRKDFARLQVNLPPKEPAPEELLWEVEITVLKVTSPNWDRDDKNRHWKGRDHNNRERFFRIDDEQFWLRVHTKKLNPLIIDTIKVQWAFVGQHRRNARVLRVLQYNGEVLADPLDDNALRALLGNYNQKQDGEPDFFDAPATYTTSS